LFKKIIKTPKKKKKKTGPPPPPPPGDESRRTEIPRGFCNRIAENETIE